MKTLLPNRKEAGRRLAKKLTAYANHSQAIVLGLPRGGVPIAYEIARALHLPLDVCLVKKLKIQENLDVTIGAIAEEALIHNYSGNITIFDRHTTSQTGVDPAQIQAIAAQAKAELNWRECCYRHFRPMLTVTNRIAIVVDDIIATGLTMHAAVVALQQHQPQAIIIATPVASEPGIKRLTTLVDDITCLVTTKLVRARDCWYEDSSPITDQQVCDLLSQETCQTLAGSC